MRLRPAKPTSNLTPLTSQRRKPLTRRLHRMMLTTQRSQIPKRIIIAWNNVIHVRSRSTTHRHGIQTPLTTTTIASQNRGTPRRPIRRQPPTTNRVTRPNHNNHHQRQSPDRGPTRIHQAANVLDAEASNKTISNDTRKEALKSEQKNVKERMKTLGILYIIYYIFNLQLYPLTI